MFLFFPFIHTFRYFLLYNFHHSHVITNVFFVCKYILHKKSFSILHYIMDNLSVFQNFVIKKVTYVFFYIFFPFKNDLFPALLTCFKTLFIFTVFTTICLDNIPRKLWKWTLHMRVNFFTQKYISQISRQYGRLAFCLR